MTMLFSLLAAAATLLPLAVFPLYVYLRMGADKALAVRLLNENYPVGKPDDYAIVCSHGRWYDRNGKHVRDRHELGYQSWSGLYAFKLGKPTL
jgi:hypothetical protein